MDYIGPSYFINSKDVYVHLFHLLDMLSVLSAGFSDLIFQLPILSAGLSICFSAFG